MRRLLLDWMLTRASAPAGARFAMVLPQLERSVARTSWGAEDVRRLSTDDRWAARYLAGRALGRVVPDHMDAREAWELLLALAQDAERAVREGAAFGIAELAGRIPEVAGWLEQLLGDSSAPLAQRRTAVRSLVPLIGAPGTTELGVRLLRIAALAGGGVSRGIGAVILGRGVGAMNRPLALSIAHDWSLADEPVLREQAARAVAGPLAGGRQVAAETCVEAA